MCVLLCLASSSDLANLRSQSFQEQVYGFSPVCVRMCAFKCELLKYILLHGLCGQQNGLGRFSSLSATVLGGMSVGGVTGVCCISEWLLPLVTVGVVKTGTMGTCDVLNNCVMSSLLAGVSRRTFPVGSVVPLNVIGCCPW